MFDFRGDFEIAIQRRNISNVSKSMPTRIHDEILFENLIIDTGSDSLMSGVSIDFVDDWRLYLRFGLTMQYNKLRKLNSWSIHVLIKLSE